MDIFWFTFLFAIDASIFLLLVNNVGLNNVHFCSMWVNNALNTSYTLAVFLNLDSEYCMYILV